MEHFFKLEIVCLREDDRFLAVAKHHVNNAHLPEFVGGLTKFSLVHFVKFWEDFLTLVR